MTRVLAVLVFVAMAAGSWTHAADPPKTESPRTGNPAGRTDLFGDPLPDGVLLRLGTTRSRASIAGFGVLPDGSVVTVSPSVEVSVWPAKGDRPGEPIRLPGFTLPPFDPRPAVSPDGRYVAANTPDKLLAVWERKDDGFKEVVSFDIGASRLLFSPDGTRIAAGSRICNLRNGKYWELDEPPGHLEAVAFSGDGKRFAGTNGYDAALWDVESGKKLAAYKTGRVRYTGIALDHTGEVLAVSPTWEPETVAFVDPMTGGQIAKLSGPEKFRCLWASFAPDGKTVLIGDRTGVTWWNPAAGKLIRRFEGMAHSWSGGQNIPARFSPDGKTLVGTSRRVLLRWDATTGKPLLPDVHDGGHHSYVTAIGVSPDGKWIATGGYDTRLRVWDAVTGRPVAAVPAAWMLGTHNLDVSPDGRFVFGPSSGDVGLSKLEASTGREVVRFGFSPDVPRRGGVIAFGLSPDGRILVALSGPHTASDPVLLARWDTESGKSLSEKPHGDLGRFHFGGAVFSPDGRWLSTSSALYLSEVGPDGNVLSRDGYSIFDPGAFSADGRLVVKELMPPPKTENSWRAGVFEVVTGLKVAEFPLASVGSLFAFHPDGRSVAITGAQGLSFLDLATGKPFAERKAPASDPDTPRQSFSRVVRYFPDGTKLVSGHADTTALVWEVPPRPRRQKALTDKERAAAWNDLASANGANGWSAVWALADDPGGVAFLGERLKPVEPLPAKEFDRLLADLGDAEFTTREAATEQLGKAGERAVGQLLAALKGELNAEQKFRVERLLAGWTGADRKPPAGGRLRVLRAVAAADLTGTAEARKLLTEWAMGAADATTTREAKRALERTKGR